LVDVNQFFGGTAELKNKLNVKAEFPSKTLALENPQGITNLKAVFFNLFPKNLKFY
jgi:hypothetical protein